MRDFSLNFRRILAGWHALRVCSRAPCGDKRIYHIILYCFFVLSLPFTAHPDETFLTASELEVVSLFNKTNDVPFDTFFTRAIHQPELCLTANAASCETEVRKRTRDFKLIYAFEELIENDRFREEAEKSINDTLEFLSSYTGIKHFDAEAPGNRRVILILFVNEEEFGDPTGELVNGLIANPVFFEPETRRRTFINYMQSDVPCLTLVDSATDGEIVTSHIWIKSDLSENLLRQCVREEIYNSLGVSEGDRESSIYDWPNPTGEMIGGYTPLHLLLLRILYMPRFETGQSMAETSKMVTDLLKASAERHGPTVD